MQEFSSEPVPDALDVAGQLAAYRAAATAGLLPDLEQAIRAQARPSCAELGVGADDRMDELGSLPFRMHVADALAASAASKAARLSGPAGGPRQPDEWADGPGTNGSAGGAAGAGCGRNGSAPAGQPASCYGRSRVALVATWAGDVWGLRRELLPWMTYHAHLGVEHFYVGAPPAAGMAGCRVERARGMSI